MDHRDLTTNQGQEILLVYFFSLKEGRGVMAVMISRHSLIAIKGPNTFGLEVPTPFNQLSLILTTFYPDIPIITSETGKKFS
jgi:hypothetical protein